MVNSGSVKEFFRGTKVLITGGSGFVGQTLVDHLLRKTEVAIIYIIIRAKREQTPQERMKSYFGSEIFSTLKEKNASALNRVVFMAGDLTQEGIGLSQENRKMLEENVEVVFHSAATVAFNENLKKAILINIGGTKQMLQLAESMRFLKVFLHVSTAFVNAHLKEENAPEQICTRDGMGPLQLLEMAKCLDEDSADKIAISLLGPTPNTYLFTKNAAEALLNTYRHLPIGIFRPAVILATKNEPAPGWINNVYGPTGVLMAMGSGLVHTMLVMPDTKADIVPVDMCANCLIVSAWDVYNRRKSALSSGEMSVYNYVSSPDSPLTWNDFMHKTMEKMAKYPPVNRFWNTFVYTTPYEVLFFIMTFVLQLLPAMLYDKVTGYFGGKPRMVAVVEKINLLNEFIRPFTLRKWTYQNKNVHILWNRLNSREKALFPFIMTEFDWDAYVEDYVKGINKFLLKIGPDQASNAKAVTRKYFWLHWGLITLIVVALNCSLQTLLICPFTPFSR